MSPLPSAWRLLHPGRVALHDLREELAAAQRRGIHVFVDVLEVDGGAAIGASPPCADPNCVSYRVGPRVFLRPGSDEELLNQLRDGLALLEPLPSEASHAAR